MLSLRVPTSQPSSPECAADLSQKYWPVFYRSHNPFGPQPADLRRAEAEISPSAGALVALAKRLGLNVRQDGFGEDIGAVIVDRKLMSATASNGVVAGAGDARWIQCHPRRAEAEHSDRGSVPQTIGPSSMGGSETGKGCGNGNPLAHAVMRAIGMVARQRVVLDGKEKETDQARTNDEYYLDIGRLDRSASSRSLIHSLSDVHLNLPFVDVPLTPLESSLISSSPLQPGGYLCTGLDIYLSHEPCIMCSMAIMHSRFSRIILARRAVGPGTGGMCTENIAGDPKGNGNDAITGKPNHTTAFTCGYGLFWKSELNWKLLGWEWVDEAEAATNDNTVGEEILPKHLHA